MSKMLISLNQTTEEDIKKLELPKQAKEILAWWFGNYGVGKEVDQKDVFKDLDSHQEDNTVLSVTPKQPISRIFQFYRKRLGDENIVTINKVAEPKAAKTEDTAGSTKGKAGDKRRKDAPAGAEDGVL